MDTKKLRQKILDLAIRGKLVPQDPNDEPASVLLERIKEEKERLIKEGKIKRNIKKSSSDTSHYRNIPQNWTFCKLSDIASFGGGKTPSTANKDFWDEENHLWVTSKDMKQPVIEDSLMKISNKGVVGMHFFSPLTILMVVRSGILRRTLPIAILKKKATINQDIKAICLYDNSIVSYVFWVLKALESSILENYQKDGTTVESIDFERFQDIVIPIPPVSEQKRIVSVIESTFALIDKIETEKQDLFQFVKTTKSKILDLAIKGKLVSQDPNDESASVLLERIKSEHPERKKKPSKTSDNSHYENLPFLIPETWIWCRLEDIAQSDLGKTLDKAKNKGIYRPYLRSVNIRWGSIDLNDLNQMKFEDEEIPRYTIQKNDLLICEGGEAGRCAVWAYEDSILYQNAIHRIRFHKLIHPYFYLYVIWLYNDINLLDEFTKGVTIKHLTKSALNNIPFPLPPMNEQIKIVDIIENLFSILKSIVDEL